MSKSQKWSELYEEASREVREWRRQHKQATLTEIENTVDAEMARLRAQMIEDLALASETAELTQLSEGERPTCPQCGRPLVANGRQRRKLTTDHEQEVELRRSKGYCRHCQVSFFPSG